VRQSPARPWQNCLRTDAWLTTASPADWAVDPSWQVLVQGFWANPTGLALTDFLSQRLGVGARLFPPEPLRALRMTALPEVKVVILGQDPYHAVNQAEGLAFSVAQGVTPPPSLRNIFKELQADLGMQPPMHGSLAPWAQQGVLLLNTCLSVEEGRPASHAKQGWEVLTDQIIQAVCETSQACVFMLWGAHAQTKKPLINGQGSHGRHLVLEANHPSPLSARRGPTPFLGCRHFSQAQTWLAAQGVALNWSLHP